jgi:hypothetical protein
MKQKKQREDADRSNANVNGISDAIEPPAAPDYDELLKES